MISFTVTPNGTALTRPAQIKIRVADREEEIGLDFKVYQAPTFGDVPVTSPINKFVSALYARNITVGCGDGSRFCPDADITRGQVAVFLQQILTETVVDSKSIYVPSPAQGATGYTDVESHPLRRFITYITRRGIVTIGCGKGVFCPNMAITRKDMVVWALRALNIDHPPQPASQRFADVLLADSAAPYIEEGFRLGLVTGCRDSDGKIYFCPDEPAKRGTMAVFLAKAFGL
jgi:hypothetical protein